MAKGDHSRVQNSIDYQGGTAQNNLNNLRTNITRQNQGFENRFNVAADQGNQDYGNLMNTGYGLLNHVTNAPMHNFGAYGGYQDFANNGGFNEQNQQDYRARAFAPIRAAYQNANREVERNKSLSGGYSPNYNAAKAKMAREQSYSLGDASNNVEASMHDAITQGKLAGLGGMTNIDSSILNNETSRLGLGSSILGQLGNIYGTAPGMAQMYGNQMNTSTGHTLDTEKLQAAIADSIMRGTLGMSDVKGNYGSAMDNVGGTLKNIYGVGGLFGGF